MGCECSRVFHAPVVACACVSPAATGVWCVVLHEGRFGSVWGSHICLGPSLLGREPLGVGHLLYLGGLLSPCTQ